MSEVVVAPWFWRAALTLAYKNGWKPQGTDSPIAIINGVKVVDEDWCGDYFSNGYQIVNKPDAAAAGAALERGLEDVPCHDAWRESGSPVELLSGPRRLQLETLIALLKGGEVMVA